MRLVSQNRQTHRVNVAEWGSAVSRPSCALSGRKHAGPSSRGATVQNYAQKGGQRGYRQDAQRMRDIEIKHRTGWESGVGRPEHFLHHFQGRHGSILRKAAKAAHGKHEHIEIESHLAPAVVDDAEIAP